MKIGCYGDVHLTKNMRSLQDIWSISATQSIYHMYNEFDNQDVEMVVCLGDFFDTPRIEAKYINLVMPLLDSINSRTYPTYILLGNHEADSSESNILEFLSTYENIHPVTSTMMRENMLFIPYYDDPQLYDMYTDTIVFTHHDIYGSDLASGKTKAFFGLDPSIFKNAKLVMNGHVHLKSKVSSNILNAGSLLVSSQGELRVGDLPSYYILDTRTGEYQTFNNEYSMIYQTIDVQDVDKVSDYDPSKLVLRIEYEGEIPATTIESLHTSWKKKLSSIEGIVESIERDSNFDMKNYLVEYLSKDQDISDADRQDYINTGLRLLSL